MECVNGNQYFGSRINFKDAEKIRNQMTMTVLIFVENITIY